MFNWGCWGKVRCCIVIFRKRDVGDNGLYLLGRLLVSGLCLYFLILNLIKWIFEFGCGKGDKRICIWGMGVGKRRFRGGILYVLLDLFLILEGKNIYIF